MRNPQPIIHAASVLDLLADWRSSEMRLDAAKSAWRRSGLDNAAEVDDLNEAREWAEELERQIEALNPMELREMSRAVMSTIFHTEENA